MAMVKGKPGEGYLLGAASLPTSELFSQLERVSGVAAPKVKYLSIEYIIYFEFKSFLIIGSAAIP